VGAGEPVIAFVDDVIGQRFAPRLVVQILSRRMAIQKLRMRDQPFLRILFAGHFVLALRGGDQLDALDARGAKRPFSQPDEVPRPSKRSSPVAVIIARAMSPQLAFFLSSSVSHFSKVTPRNLNRGSANRVVTTSRQ